MCAGALQWAQLDRIVYGAADDKRGFMRFGKAILHRLGVEHQPPRGGEGELKADIPQGEGVDKSHENAGKKQDSIRVGGASQQAG